VASGVFACTDGCGAASPTLCGGSCVDLADDVHHCGDCGTDCTQLAHVNPQAVFCQAGACTVPASACAPGFADCTGGAADSCETDVTTAAHCGACGTVCAVDGGEPVCSQEPGASYACASRCSGATPAACGAACVNLDGDAHNCGACGHDCTAAPGAGAGAVCAAGSCVYPQVGGCAAGLADCDGVASNGCEADVTQASACGACNVSCGGTAAQCLRTGSTYACASGCTGSASDTCAGSCTSFQSDTHNCGSCGFDCTQLAHVSGAVACVTGTCTVPAASCAPGFKHCSTSAADGCETDLSSTASCGDCGVTCSGGTPLCSNVGGTYQCAPACAGATPTECSGSCVSLSTNSANCGGCGNPCTGGTSCQGGVCTCAQGYASCGAQGCRDLANDVTSCGA
jgi:hypothetical protein